MSNKKLPPLTKDEYRSINATMFGMTDYFMKKFPDHPEFKDNFMLDIYINGVQNKPDAALFVDKARPEIFKHADALWLGKDELIDDPSIEMFSMIDMPTLYPRLSKEEKTANWDKIHTMMRQMKVPGGANVKISANAVAKTEVKSFAPSASASAASASSVQPTKPDTKEPADKDLAFLQTEGMGNLAQNPMDALQQGAHALLRGRDKMASAAAAATDTKSSSTSTEAPPVPGESQTSSAENYFELFEALQTLMDNLEKEDSGATVDDDGEEEEDPESDSDKDEKDNKTNTPKKVPKQGEQAAMKVVFNMALMNCIQSMADARGDRFPVLNYCRDYFCVGVMNPGTTQRQPAYFSGSHLSRSEAFDVMLAIFRKYPGFAGQVELPKHMLEVAPISEDAKKQGELIDEKTGMALNQALGIKVANSSSSKSGTHISKRQKEQAMSVTNREKYILEDKIPELKVINAREIYLNFAKKESNRDTVWKYVDKAYQIIDKAEEVRNGDFKGFGKLANRILQEIAAGMATNSKEEKDANPMQKMATVLTQAAKKLDRKKRRKEIRNLMTTFDDPDKANRAFELIGDIGGSGLADEMRREYTTASTTDGAAKAPSS